MTDYLDQRSQEILYHIVDAYLETGEPVGSRTLARKLGLSLSPATIRNVMADLEDGGLLYAPHTSAGRLPTEAGLRLFVNGLLEVGDLTPEETRQLETRCQSQGRTLSDVLEQVSLTLSGLSQCAGVVVAPKHESTLRQVEFVQLSPGKALVILISDTGDVENRIIDVPLSLPPAALVQATNYLNAHLNGLTLQGLRTTMQSDLELQRGELDHLTGHLIETGLAAWSGEPQRRNLIIRGHSHLLNDVNALTDLERVRKLLTALETQEELVSLLDTVIDADGVQIFIGSENQLFGLSGCSMIVAPYSDSNHKILGAVGVIGPTRLNYGRVIPMVNYTARLIERLLKKSD
jgi:heat-inducible transcriptional repressor